MKPCPVHHLDLDESSKKHIGNLVVTNRSFASDRGEACRILVDDMKIYFFDRYNNRTSYTGDYIVSCSITRDADTANYSDTNNANLPDLVGATRGRLHGERLGNSEGVVFKCIQIVEDSGERSEFLRLRFDFRPCVPTSKDTHTNANGNLSSSSSKTQMTDSDMVYEPIFIPFQFTTDQEMVIKLAEVQAQLNPMREIIWKLYDEKLNLTDHVSTADHFIESKWREINDIVVRYSINYIILFSKLPNYVIIRTCTYSFIYLFIITILHYDIAGISAQVLWR